MMNKWCEYQNTLNPWSRCSGHGSFTRLRRNQGVASSMATIMSVVMKIPVNNTGILTTSAYDGWWSKSCPKYSSNLSCGALTNFGMSQVKWQVAWMNTPTAIPHAIICTTLNQFI
jgi:hypothetical protein